MNGRGKLDKTHPDCAKYTEEFYAIWDAYHEKENQETEKRIAEKKFDRSENQDLVVLYRECCRKTKLLQEKYAYLWRKE